MTRVLLFASAAAACLAADLAAQVTVPAGLTTPGNSSQTSNWRGGRRHQIVLDPRAVPGIGRMLQGLVLHADNFTGTGLPAQLDVTVLVSSLGVPLPSHVDRTSYSANLGTDATVVVNARRITAPTAPNATLALPFAVPFAYANGNPLLLQIDFMPVPTPGIDNPTWMLDAHDLPDDFWGISGTTLGSACPAPGQWTVWSDRVNERLQFRWGGPAGPQGLLAYVLFGLSDTHLGAIPLPLDLTPFNMPGCMLRTSMEAALPTTTVAGGGFSWVLVSASVPRDPLLTGQTMFAQAMVFDPASNSPGLSFSELQREQLVTPPSPVLASHAYGPNAAMFPNNVPEVVVRNRTLVLGLQ